MPTFHHEAYLRERCEVGERVAGYGNEVGGHFGFERAELILLPQQVGCI